MTYEAHVSDWTAYHTPESVRRAELPEGHVERSALLDKPSDPHPILNTLMDEALLRIMLVSDGAVMALTAKLTGSRTPSTPTSYLAAIIENLVARYEKCKTHRRRLVIIKEAQATADRLRYSPKSDILSRGTQEWRQAIANDPRPRRVVAEDYRVSPRTITAARKEFGRDGSHLANGRMVP